MEVSHLHRYTISSSPNQYKQNQYKQGIFTYKQTKQVQGNRPRQNICETYSEVRICVPIGDIFNQSTRRGKLPEDRESVKVTPLFKQGDRDSVNNYRPISVIPVSGRGIGENIIRTIICLSRGAR